MPGKREGFAGRLSRLANRCRWGRGYWPVAAAMLAMLLAAPAHAKDKFVFCLEKADVRPWRTKEGGGLNVELLNRVAQRLDVEFEYRGMPWKRCLAQLKANEVHGVFGASFRPDRLSIGVYPGGEKADPGKRLNMGRYVLVRRRGTTVHWDGKAFHDLDGPIGVQLGYSVGESLKAKGISIDDGSLRAHELALKLIAKRVAAAAMFDGEATIINSDPKLAAQLEILPATLEEKPYFLMLSHQLVNTRGDMAMRIWNTIEEVRNSAAYQKLERKAMAGVPE